MKFLEIFLAGLVSFLCLNFGNDEFKIKQPRDHMTSAKSNDMITNQFVV